MNSKSKGIATILSVLGTVSICCILSSHATADEACAGTSPRVCVKKSGAVVEETHFTFGFTDPDNPDIELITGASDWEVWSVVSVSDSTPANIGTLSIDQTAGSGDFVVKIANGTGFGAANVGSILLQPPTDDYSSIAAGSKINGDLTGNLILQENSFGTGATANFTIEGDVTGNINVGNAAGLTIEGTYGESGGEDSELTVTFVSGGAFNIGALEDADLHVTGKVSFLGQVLAPALTLGC